MILIVLICELGYSLGIVFVACVFGQHMSNSFNQIVAEIDQFDWYLFPIEMQQILPILLMATQKPVDVAVFGSVKCDRENCKKVSRIPKCIILREAHSTGPPGLCDD